MSQSGDPNSERTGDPEPRWRLPLTWIGLLAAAWVLYELTYQPALGTAIICLKFTVEDFRSANWLLRRDPIPQRGRAYWWLYVAFGLAKATGVGALTEIVVLASLTPLIGGPGEARLWQASIGAAAFCGVALPSIFLAATAAVAIARRGRFRLWLDGAANQARRKDLWPPCRSARRHENLLVRLLLIGGAPMLFAALIIALIALPQGLPGWTAPVPAVIPLVGGLYTLWAGRVVAVSPWQCWASDEEPSLDSA